MLLEQAIRELAEAAGEAAARRVLETAPAERRFSLIPIKSTPIAYRVLLDAERRGELRVYRIGKASLVDASELEAWIRAHGSKPSQAARVDEVAELIELANERRGRRRLG